MAVFPTAFFHYFLFVVVFFLFAQFLSWLLIIYQKMRTLRQKDDPTISLTHFRILLLYLKFSRNQKLFMEKIHYLQVRKKKYFFDFSDIFFHFHDTNMIGMRIRIKYYYTRMTVIEKYIYIVILIFLLFFFFIFLIFPKLLIFF